MTHSTPREAGFHGNRIGTAALSNARLQKTDRDQPEIGSITRGRRDFAASIFTSGFLTDAIQAGTILASALVANNRRAP